MERDIKLDCPCCGAILFVDRISGEITETRKPLVEKTTGDRLEDAFLKSREDQKKRDLIFKNMMEDQEKKKKLSEELFSTSLKEAKKEGPKKPGSIFDAD